MTTNIKQFAIEYYMASQAEDSDPDPIVTLTADNTDDLFTELSRWLYVHDVANVDGYRMADMTHDGDLRYFVYSSTSVPAVGVAIVVYGN